MYKESQGFQEQLALLEKRIEQTAGTDAKEQEVINDDVRNFLLDLVDSYRCGFCPADPKDVPFDVGTIVHATSLLEDVVSYPADTTVFGLEKTLSEVRICIADSNRGLECKDIASELMGKARAIDQWLENSKALIRLLEFELTLECRRFVENAEYREVFSSWLDNI